MTKSPLSENLSDDFDEPEAIDDETIENDATVKPWDPGKIRITTKSFSLRDVVSQIDDKEIDLAPDFQREFVWKERQKTRLIESILLGIPLPAFYFNQGNDGRYQVVDGVQRLSTVSMFMNNQHRLDKRDLEYLTDLDGCTYNELGHAAMRRFRSTQIVVHVIEPQTPDEVKYDIFSRVNTLGSPLSAQEIRHAMSKPRSRKFLGILVECEEFDRATEYQYWRTDRDTGNPVRDGGRMTNRELALRFCAFRDFDEEIYREYASLDSYLIEYTRRIDGQSDRQAPLGDRDLKRLTVDFKNAMLAAERVLGGAAFRRWPPGQARRGPINRAVFEAQAIALADFSLREIEPKSSRILESFREAFMDYEYLRAVTVGTGDPKAVSTRLSMTKDILKGAVK